jgi:hypothetical protein
MIDRIGIQLPKIFGVCVRIRERLKVNDEFMRVESLSNVFDSFAHLITDGIRFYRGRRPERAVIAIGASADCDLAVTVRAREARIDDDLVYSLPEFFLEPTIVGAEPFGTT